MNDDLDPPHVSSTLHLIEPNTADIAAATSSGPPQQALIPTGYVDLPRISGWIFYYRGRFGLEHPLAVLSKPDSSDAKDHSIALKHWLSPYSRALVWVNLQQWLVDGNITACGLFRGKIFKVSSEAWLRRSRLGSAMRRAVAGRTITCRVEGGDRQVYPMLAERDLATVLQAERRPPAPAKLPEGRAQQEQPFETGFAGRPTKSKHLIIAQHEARMKQGIAEWKISAEAQALQSWLMKAHPLAARPAVKTIENGIRERHRQWRAKNPQKNPRNKLKTGAYFGGSDRTRLASSAIEDHASDETLSD